MSPARHLDDLPIFKGAGNAPRLTSQKIFVRFHPTMDETDEKGIKAASGKASKGRVFWLMLPPKIKCTRVQLRTLAKEYTAEKRKK